MRYLKLQIALLFLLTVNAGWLVGADNKDNKGDNKERKNAMEGEAFFHNLAGTFAEASKEGSRPQVNIGYAPNSNPSQNTNCDQSTNNNLALDWWSQVKMQTLNTLITNVGLPLGIQAFEKGYEFYKQRSDPKGYAAKKAAAEMLEEMQKTMNQQMLVAQTRLNGALVREKELAGQYTVAQLIQTQRKEVEGFIAGYEQKIQAAFKQRDEIVNMSDIPEGEKKKAVQMVQKQVMNYYQTLAGFNQAYDNLAQLTILASDMRTPEKLEALGVTLEDKKQPNQKKNKIKTEQKHKKESNKSKSSLSPQSPYDAIDALLSTELDKIESKLQQDDAELTESSE